MRFEASEAETALRTEVRRVLAEPAVAGRLAELRASGEREPDVRPIYRELGRRGLLAVGWPVRYGGRDAGHLGAAGVAEELVRAGVPDMLHVLSVQIVGLFVLQAGSEAQQARHLPALAAGESFATVLYTEPEAGSDLASLRATGVADGDDAYRLSGTKVWGLKSSVSDLGLCAVRTGEGASPYDGISLFLVDLRAPGVTRSTIASIADEQFDLVELDDVRVPREDLLGEPGDGWGLLTRCLAIERTGLDYALKAERWYGAGLRAAAGAIAADRAAGVPLADLGRHGAAVEAARLLAWEVVSGLERDVVDPVAAARAKLHTSETAQRVGVWAALQDGAALPPGDAATVDSGYREAPGLSLSAGTSEMMLELVASTLSAAPGKGARRGSVA